MPSLFNAIEKYEGIREATYQFAQNALARRIAARKEASLTQTAASIRFGPIDDAALAAIWNPSEFDWKKLYSDFQPYLNRFEVAIWADGKLCAMGYGRPSKGNDNVTIHFVERCKGDNPLKGSCALLITETAEFYAKVLDKQKVKLKDPYPHVRRLYMELGFVPGDSIGSTDYMERRIGQ